MPFVAECTFCRLMLQGVPDRRLGSSVECPRCHNSFTLAPMSQPVAAATRGPRMAHKKAPKLAASPTEAPLALPPRSEAQAALPIPPHPPLTIVESEEQPPPIVPAVPANGLISFMLGSAAFLTAALFSIGLLTFLLGVASVLFGVLGFVFSSRSRSRPLLAAVGGVVGLSAAIIACFWPRLLGLSPLRNPPPVALQGSAAISLDGKSGFRQASKNETLWVDASKDALHHGDVRVRVHSAIVGAIDFEPIRDRQSPRERGLVLRLRITNAGIARKIPYVGWGEKRSQNAPMLRDNLGLTYRLRTFEGGWIVKGWAVGSSIPSGKSLNDVLVFDAPPSGIEYLRLELPAAAAGGEGTLHLEIPKSMIVFR